MNLHTISVAASSTATVRRPWGQHVGKALGEKIDGQALRAALERLENGLVLLR